VDDGLRTADLVPADGDEEGIRVVGTTAMTAAVLERLRTEAPAAARTGSDSRGALAAGTADEGRVGAGIAS
jgi:hypothetical protein